ncbi:hypothetical protein [Clostridium sp. C105KSO13]|uniref:hypothetical protein n=1 Tax=Clostridium sp. C105KSO13 TaxID=1776045 RepID=UPI0007406920|nr:hypothetical protein [Clostridium sp. C105KSO13]CUX23282.1 hypothetical protein BN3456_00649 [Clostridium sp. C105KSO13]
MLDEKDLQAIARLMDASESRITTKIDETENLLLDEIGRTQSYLEKQISEVKKNIDELNQYYRITKLENDNTALLLKMIESLQKDVEELKKKTA